MANLLEVKTKSKSDASRPPYVTVLDASGRLGCDCRGWTVHKPGKGALHEFGRMCTHTKDLVKKYGLKTEQRGDYVFATNLSGVKAPQPVTVPSPVVKGKASKLPTKAAKPVATVGGIKIIDLDDSADDLNPYVEPMLASPFPEGQTLENFCVSSEAVNWLMEEKFDGHRVVFAVKSGAVSAWSRPKAGKEAIKRTPGDPGWPMHIVAELAKLPDMTGDGEVCFPGGTSSDVTDLTKQDELIFVTFDVMRLMGEDTTDCRYDERRGFLSKIFASTLARGFSFVRLAEAVPPRVGFVKSIWDRGGEGAILKRTAAKYQPGARSRDFIKVKGCETAVMTLTGYKKGKLGPHATVVLKGADGSETTVKTLDNDSIRAFALNPDSFIGRKLRIEYQARTADGSYRHPRWDRWETE